jgi:CDGSH iron-sulfur domain-containing protein 3
MGHTEKPVLMTSDLIMEDKKEFKSQATVEVIDNGPVKITGNILIRDVKRDITENLQEVSLCRCGRSVNKPYCDDSHKKQS